MSCELSGNSSLALQYPVIASEAKQSRAPAVIASEAKQSILPLHGEMDCFAALAMTSSPPMTVIRWNYNSVGEAAAHLIIDRIKDPTLPTRRLRFPTELVIRGSCAPPPR